MSGVSERERDKPRHGVVANTLNLFRHGAVGFVEWLGFVVSHFRGRLPVVKPAVLSRIEPYTIRRKALRFFVRI